MGCLPAQRQWHCLCRFALGRLSLWIGVILTILKASVLQCLMGKGLSDSTETCRDISGGVSVPSPSNVSPAVFGCLWLLVCHQQLLLLVKCSPTAEIGLGSEPLGCLVELNLSLIHVIQHSLQPTGSAYPS